MSRGINKVILIGHLGQNPEFIQSGAVKTTRISVATSETWKDKTTRERQEQTEWHRVVFFGRLAEVAAEYLKKGSQVYVEGRLQTNKWTDKHGSERATTQIIANALQMLDPKGAAQTTEPKPLQDDDDIEF